MKTEKIKNFQGAKKFKKNFLPRKTNGFPCAKKSKDFFSINKDTLILDLVKKHPETADVFFEIGMHCIGCPMAGSESIEEGAKAHDIKVSELLEKINKKINS